jgi:hypothetical protein
MITTSEPAAPAETRHCGYCGQPFDPKGNTGRRYCSPRHAKNAAGRRRRGNDSRQPPERAATCPWCEAEFTTRLPEQLFCTTAHRKRAMTCERTRGFLTLPAAEAAATETTSQAEPYRCPAAGTPHWHLRINRRPSAPSSVDLTTDGDGT